MTARDTLTFYQQSIRTYLIINKLKFIKIKQTYTLKIKVQDVLITNNYSKQLYEYLILYVWNFFMQTIWDVNKLQNVLRNDNLIFFK